MIAHEFEDVQFRLEWDTICKLACKCMVHKMDFERMVEAILAGYLAEKGVKDGL